MPLHQIISQSEAEYIPDLRLRFNVRELPTWFALAWAGGTSTITEDRKIAAAYLEQPRLWLERVVLPQLDWLDAQGLPLAIVCKLMWGNESDEAMDFDGPIEAARNPRLDRWCAEVPEMLAIIATMVDHRADYIGSYANDPDVAAARARGRAALAAYVFASLNPVQRGSDSIAFDQVCQLRAEDPVYRELLRMRRRLERPCWAESRPTMETTHWARDGWGFMFEERHLLLRGDWLPLTAIRSYRCPIARMTVGLPGARHLDPNTGRPWEEAAWADSATRVIRAEGDIVVRRLLGLTERGLTRKDFE